MGRLEYIRNRLKDRKSSVGKAMTFDRYLMLSPKERYPEIECLVDVSEATLNGGSDSDDWRAGSYETGAMGNWRKFKIRDRELVCRGGVARYNQEREVRRQERAELDFLRSKDPKWR